MRNKVVKVFRRLAKQLATTQETTYVFGKQPVFNESNKAFILTSGRAVRPYGIVVPGIPTLMKPDCTKFILKALKKAKKRNE